MARFDLALKGGEAVMPWGVVRADIGIRAGRIVFIEFKAPGEKPTALQWRMIERLRGAGCEVHVCDSVEAGCHALSL